MFCLSSNRYLKNIHLQKPKTKVVCIKNIERSTQNPYMKHRNANYISFLSLSTGIPRDEVKDRYFRCYLSAMVVYISSFIFKTTIELFYHIVLHGANKVDRSCYQNFICIFAKERLLCSCNLDDNIILQNSL